LKALAIITQDLRIGQPGTVPTIDRQANILGNAYSQSKKGDRPTTQELPRMTMLILGLVLFLGLHSVRIFAERWRARQIARMGEGPWKGIYSLISIAGFVLLIWGFAEARRLQPVLLYVPPLALRHANALFTLIAFVLVAAAFVPRNHFKAKLGHPMLAGVKVWALGHLLATGMLHDVILFGAFLIWAIAGFTVSRRRDRLAGILYPAGTAIGDVLSIAVGIAAWAAFAFFLHARWIGVAPFG
jgi:uncharacterized membrane protein